jgi:hypothetical protein
MSGQNVQPEALELPSPPLESEKPPSAASQARAEAEAQGFASRNLDDEARVGEHDRTEQLRHHFHCAAISGVWLGFIVLAVGLISFVWNELTPRSWEWMTDAQMSAVKTFFFSGAVVGVAQKYLGPRMK